MADGDVLKISGGHQVFGPAPGGGGGVTVDNETDPPVEVTTIVAPGAAIAGSEATFVTFPPGWFFDTDTGALIIDTTIAAYSSIRFRGGTDPDFYLALSLAGGGIGIQNADGDEVMSIDETGTILPAGSAGAGIFKVINTDTGLSVFRIRYDGAIGFNGVTPTTQSLAIADATTEAEAVTQLNTLLAYLRLRGDIAT